MICFHGYGEQAGSFSFLEPALTERFTIIAIDLPFHGSTQWNEGRPCTANDLNEILKLIRDQLFPKPDPGSRMVLLAYSLGGRLALSLYQTAPELFSKVILLAPDGLKMNAWYWFATQTWAGNKIFRLTMHKPGWFFGILKLGNKAGLVNSSIFKFVNYYIVDPEVRKQLYARWTGFRKCKPSLNHIRHLVPVHHTGFRLLYGKHDRIIRHSSGERFCDKIPVYGSLRLLDSGHQLLHPKYSSFIVEAILL